MKALELTVYPHVEDGGIDCIEDSEGTLRTPRELNGLADYKRLTDAELAAEYWRDAREFLTRANSAGERLDRIARWATLHRFATLPHYDEDHQ